MPTNYPFGLDAFVDPTASQPQNNPSHSSQHGNLNDAMLAVQTFVGTSGSPNFARIASPAFTGTPAAPTAAPGTNTTQLATTAYTTAAVLVETNARTTATSLLAPKASPALTGTPTAPTATNGTNTTQIATTAFVIANGGTGNVIARTGNGGAVLPPYIGPPASGDTTGATDFTNITNAINNAISAAPSGSQPWLLLPPGNYYTNATIQIPGWLHLQGSGGITQATVINQASGTTLDAIMASTGWTTNANSVSVYPVHIHDLLLIGITGQASGFGHGLVLQSFQSNVECVYVQNVKGDGIRFDNCGVNGSTAVGNTMVENYIRRCEVRTCGRGIMVADTTNSTVTDMWILDNLVQNPTGNAAIYNQAGAGTKIDGNHVYGVPYSGIKVDKLYDTAITNNYVENAGSGASSGTYAAYDCGDFNNDGGQGSVIANNRFRQTTIGNAGSTVIGIYCQVGNGNQQNVAVFGNVFTMATGTGTIYGLYFANQGSTCTTNIALGPNALAGTYTARITTAAAGGVMNVTGLPQPITLVSNATTVPVVNSGIVSCTNSSAATMTITLATAGAFDGQQVTVRIFDFSAAAETITWVNTENSSVSAPTTSNGSTTLPRTAVFEYNAASSKWRCVQNA